MSETFILFTLAGTTYALRTRDVLHMEMVGDITPVPNAAAFVEGVVLSRGQVVPVVNLRTRFGFDRAPHDLRSRILVVQGGAKSVGLLVDAAREFVTIAAEAVQPPQETLTGLSGKYLEGIVMLGERIVLVIELAGVLDFADRLVSA